MHKAPTDPTVKYWYWQVEVTLQDGDSYEQLVTAPVIDNGDVTASDAILDYWEPDDELDALYPGLRFRLADDHPVEVVEVTVKSYEADDQSGVCVWEYEDGATATTKVTRIPSV